MAHLHTHNDLPSPVCQLQRDALVEQIARNIASSTPPLVFGIHGDWGAGKTSFLCHLAYELSGRCPLFPEHQRPRVCHDIDNVFTVWFEAWRYQQEPAPVVALLHELCRQLPKHKQIADWLKKASVVLTKGIFGTIREVSADIEAKPLGVGGKVSVKVRNPLEAIAEEEKRWDDAHFAQRLTTDSLRELLSKAMGELLPPVKKSPYGKARVCVIIDDLDRCQPEAALRLIEGIKIFLAIPECVFVLGVNIRQIQKAIVPLLPGPAGQPEAAEYLEKLCTYTWELPFPTPAQSADLLHHWLDNPALTAAQTRLSDSLRTAIHDAALLHECLPANPRKIKALANTIRQLTAKVWGASPPVGGFCAAPATEAEALLAAASIYHFHPQLLSFLQTRAGMWQRFIQWLGNKAVIHPGSDFGKVLTELRRSEVTLSDDKGATPGSGTPVDNHPDPIHLNVLRIERLLRAGSSPTKETITPAQMARYLDLPA